MVATETSGAEASFRTVDTHLKLLAEVGLAATAAETAAGEGEIGVADDALDRAGEALAELRAAWPEMSPAERAIVGPAATALRTRIDRARVRLPRRFALSAGAPEHDPDEEVDPARAAARRRRPPRRAPAGRRGPFPRPRPAARSPRGPRRAAPRARSSPSPTSTCARTRSRAVRPRAPGRRPR